MKSHIKHRFHFLMVFLLSICSCSQSENESPTGETDLPLRVVSTIPESSAAAVPLDVVISAVLSDPPSSDNLNEKNLLLFSEAGVTNIQNNVISFRPDEPLRPSTIYNVTLYLNEYGDGESERIEPYTWTFSTGLPDTLPGFPARRDLDQRAPDGTVEGGKDD
ncbi:MAG: Ig-like domain-containing protein [bacterium]|nr:Ig-like domain-containing protein [bacterium]